MTGKIIMHIKDSAIEDIKIGEYRDITFDMIEGCTKVEFDSACDKIIVPPSRGTTIYLNK